MNHTMLKDNWRKCHFSILCQLGFWFFCCANCRIFAWFSPSLCVSCLLHSSVRFWLHSRRISMQKSSQSTVVKKCKERSHFGTILTWDLLVAWSTTVSFTAIFWIYEKIKTNDIPQVTWNSTRNTSIWKVCDEISSAVVCSSTRSRVTSSNEVVFDKLHREFSQLKFPNLERSEEKRK